MCFAASQWIIADVSTKGQKHQWMNFLTMSSALLMLLISFLGNQQLGNFTWRALLVVPQAIGVAILVLMCVHGKGVNHTEYLLKEYGEQGASAKMEQYARKKHIKAKISRSKSELKQLNSSFALNFNRKTQLGYVESHKKEIIQAILIISACVMSSPLSFPLITAYSNLNQILVSEEILDIFNLNVELLVEVTVYIILIHYNLSKYKHQIFTWGLVAMMVANALAFISVQPFLKEIMLLSKVMFGIGSPLLYGTVYVYLKDLLPTNLLFVGLTAQNILALVSS